MSQLENISQELYLLQEKMQQSVDQIGVARQRLNQAHREGYLEGEFLPRRLAALKNKVELQFDSHLRQFDEIIWNKLDVALLHSQSPSDVETMLKIRKTVRYIRNAFAGETQLTPSLNRLQTISQDFVKKETPKKFRIL